MTKKQFIKDVATATEQPQSVVKEVVEEVLVGIQTALVNGIDVQFPGFGTFTTIKRAARKGRNPSTGKEMMFAASTGVKFKVGAALKRAVKEG